MIDAGPLAAPPGALAAAVHEAARRFAAAHDGAASLTLLLPAERLGDPAVLPASGTGLAADDWTWAGDAAAARMLVATLACELASRALRVNAVAVSPDVDPVALRALLRHVAGARSQFLTGQTLRTMQ